MVGGIATLIVVAGLVAAGPSEWHQLFTVGDSPFFLAVAHHPFASGGIPGNHLVYGLSYRYGRVAFPLVGWLFAFGRPAWVSGTLLGVFVASFGAWIALAAEQLRRMGRRPALALWILALPFCLLSIIRPVVISEPMAGALVFLVYLLERDGRRRAMYVAAAVLILTREPVAIALLPLVWGDWKQRGGRALRGWLLALAPYAAWVVWVRLRVGQFPFADPSTSRRHALGVPFVAMARVWNLPASGIQLLGIVVALATIGAAVFVAIRRPWCYPVTHGALALSALTPFLGMTVFLWPGEAIRVMAPAQALLLVAALNRGGSAPVEGTGDVVLVPMDAS